MTTKIDEYFTKFWNAKRYSTSTLLRMGFVELTVDLYSMHFDVLLNSQFVEVESIEFTLVNFS